MTKESAFPGFACSDPGVNLGSLKPGDTVRFTVVKDAKGVYQIGSLTASN